MENKLTNNLEQSIAPNNTTSPSQLQEVTLDPDVTNNFSYMGMRSPGAPTNGRSVKEIDEQLTNLKKENFNLKLRLYFIEEGMMGANFNPDKEDAIKKHIELQVDLQNVRKELDEKQTLLCQAAKALEIEEDERKKDVTFRDQQIAEMKEAIANLSSQLENELQSREERQQMALCAQAFDLNFQTDHMADIIQKLQSTIKDLQEELKKEREKTNHFESVMELAGNAHARCKTLETQVEERDNKLCDLTSELEMSASKLSSYNLQIDALEEELNEKTMELQNTLVQLKTKERDLKENQTKMKELTKKYEVLVSQKEKQEKRLDKYKNLAGDLETKNSEMQLCIDDLKSKAQALEYRLEAAMQEVNRKTNRNQNVSNVEQTSKTSNTDVALFSVWNTNAVPEAEQLPKTSPKVSGSQKSLHFDSPTKTGSSKKDHKNTSHSKEPGESPPAKSASMTDLCGEIQLSKEEYLELRKDHVKACQIIKSMIKKKKEYTTEISKLNELIRERDKENQSLQVKISELNECRAVIMTTAHKKKSIQEKVCEMNLTASTNPADNLENSMAADEKHLVEQYKELANELENKIEVLHATLEQKDSQLERFKLELQEKANRIIDLEFELLALNEGISNLDEKEEDEGTEKLIQEKYEKERQIEKLENELRKRTCDLQGIVNKELWEKNRSIEKMQIVLKTKDHEINRLEKNVYGKDLQLKILKDKINELGVHVNLPPGLITIQACSEASPFGSAGTVQEQLKLCLEERKHFMREIEELQVKLQNTPEHDENRQLTQLQTEYRDLREELEKSEKLRQESQEICSILSTRLEELCYFLDSLLKQKSVLGFLGNEQTRKVQQIINRSLDLSRTLSASMTLNPDQSLLQLSNITNLLNVTRNDSMNLSNIFLQDEENNAILSIIPSDITLTYQSRIIINNDNTEENEVIKVLREQVTNLKREIEIRDIELAKKLTDSTSEEKLMENDEQFVDVLVDMNGKNIIQIHSPETIFQDLVEDTSKLNVTSSTLVAEKSATSTTLKNHRTENQSESESWSEPDRTVSMARIGLMDESLKRPSTTSSSGRRHRFGEMSDFSTDSTEDDHAHSMSKTPSKRTTLAESRQTMIALHEQVCELELKLKDKENQLLAAQVAYYESDNHLKQEQAMLEEMKRQLVRQTEDSYKKLEETEKRKCEAERKTEESNEKLAQLTVQIKEANTKLKEAEEKEKQAEHKITDLQRIVTVLEEFKENVEKTMSMKDKEMQNMMNTMEIERSKAITAVHTTEQFLEEAKHEKQMLEEELKHMQNREQRIREELEVTYQNNLKEAEEQYLNNVKTIELDYEAQANKCREAVVQIKASYEKEYIKKSEVEQRALRVDEITKEVENLKYVIEECDAKMRAMDEKEAELTGKLQSLQQEHANKIYELQQELDGATLQYSQEMLEKTKVKNENENLKQHIQRFHEKETELIKEVQDLHDDFQKEQTTLQLIMSRLEQQKSLLESKVIDLETVNAQLHSTNAELRNRLVKIQISRNVGEPAASTSLPNCPGNMFDLFLNKSMPMNIPSSSFYARQLSDHSGYTSEDVPQDDIGTKNVTGFVQAAIHSIFGQSDADQERVLANASPDLGIESDHGRFSSLEANVNLPRPLLPTLELTQSMSNLLDPVQDITCANDQCSKKLKQITNENVDLRKRLLRTRRALEETLNRLTLANKQKKEVEKSICRQIHKTSQVLRKAKANLDSGSETDILKK